MRTEITLEEFLYVMNQDEDMRVTLIDYDDTIGSRIITAWKSGLINEQEYTKHKDWKVQDFILTERGLEIVITQFEPED